MKRILLFAIIAIMLSGIGGCANDTLNKLDFNSKDFFWFLIVLVFAKSLEGIHDHLYKIRSLLMEIRDQKRLE